METLEWIKIIAGSLFLLCGIVIFFTELFGVFRFRYVLNRMHAAAMGDTLGITSCLVGLMIFSGFCFTTLKLLLIIVFLWFASPVSSHVLSRLEAATNEHLTDYCEVYEDLEVLKRELAAQQTQTETQESAAQQTQTETQKPAAQRTQNSATQADRTKETEGNRL